MSPVSNAAQPGRFEAAVQRFDQANSEDPNRLLQEGVPIAREVLYAQWLTDWVLRLAPEASEALRLAARCQHLCRWVIPRESYPPTRAGYLTWRAELKQFHAQKSAEILRQTGYPEEQVCRVTELVLKKNFPRDPEARALEDALCLVFLEHQFSELARKSSDEQMVNALRKSWNKMTPQARQLALGLSYGPREKVLLDQALQASERPRPKNAKC